MADERASSSSCARESWPEGHRFTLKACRLLLLIRVRRLQRMCLTRAFVHCKEDVNAEKI
jgi:hypothetical protein